MSGSVSMLHLVVTTVFVLSQDRCEELTLTTGARHDQDPNPGSNGCEPSTLPINFLAVPYSALMSVNAKPYHIKLRDIIRHEVNNLPTSSAVQCCSTQLQRLKRGVSISTLATIILGRPKHEC